MAKTDKKKNKSSSLAKRGKAKTTGNNPIDVDTPLPQETEGLHQTGRDVLLDDLQDGVHHQHLVKGDQELH
jgi:hypothetical protein